MIHIYEETIREVKVYKNILQKVLNEELDWETKDWIQNLINCFDYILDDSNNFPTEGKVYKDLLNTISLLYEWLFNNEWWAWIELRQKYKTVPFPENIGEALKLISERLKSLNSTAIECEKSIEMLHTAWEQVLFSEVNNSCQKSSISNLKKRIKYCKNPMEQKKLQQELNSLYKEQKRKNLNNI